jgi:predicted esterase
VEQGAIMALAAAVAVPDFLSGVIAIEGRFPLVPGWEPPLAALNDLPVLIVDPTEGIARQPGMLTGTSLVEQFEEWGAAVTRHVTPNSGIPADVMRRWVSEQKVRTAKHP